MKRIKIGVTQEQKDKISKKNKEWSDSKTCPECGRRNAISFFVDSFQCRWCGFVVERD